MKVEDTGGSATGTLTPPNGTPETPSDKKNDALARADVQGAGFGSSHSLALMQRGAQLLAASSLVPSIYQGNVANCAIALNMALRMGADPLMVMQNLFIVHGKPGWSSQFLIATFNTCGRFAPIRYETRGEEGKPDRGCRAYSTILKSGERIEGTWITMQLANDEGWIGRKDSKWKTMPEQMLMYRAAAFFIRTHAPELAMGLHTTEEILDMTPGPEGAFVVRDLDGKSKLDALGDTLRQQRQPIEGEVVSTTRGEGQDAATAAASSTGASAGSPAPKRDFGNF